MKKMVKIFKFLGLGAIILAGGCLVSFNLIGSTVAPDGMLQEPFFLIIAFWIFLFSGFIMAVGSLALYVAARVRQ